MYQTYIKFLISLQWCGTTEFRRLPVIASHVLVQHSHGHKFHLVKFKTHTVQTWGV